MTEEKRRFIYAYDPKMEERVIHVIKENQAISLITENKIKYPVKGEKAFTLKEMKENVFKRIKSELQ